MVVVERSEECKFVYHGFPWCLHWSIVLISWKDHFITYERPLADKFFFVKLDDSRKSSWRYIGGKNPFWSPICECMYQF